MYKYAIHPSKSVDTRWHSKARQRGFETLPDIRLCLTRHAEIERQKDNLAKLDVQNMLKRCSVSKVEDTDGEETWRAEGTDIDGRRVTAVVVAYEDEHNPEIKIVTTWAAKAK